MIYSWYSGSVFVQLLMYKSLYTASVFLIHFLQHTEPQSRVPGASLAAVRPLALPKQQGNRRDQSNVVIFNWLSIDITVVDKNCHHSLKHPLLHLTHL